MALSQGAVVPFPLTHRAGLVDRLARSMAVMPSDAADQHLLRQLELHQDQMQQQGIDQDTIDHALIALVHAVRAQLWRQGGVA